MWKRRLGLFRSSSKRREEESIANRRMLLQQALLERYRLVPGVTGGKGCISFECFSKPRFFLCRRQNNLIIERYKDSEEYKIEATFVILENMWFQGFFAFECLSNPGWFIRRTASGLSLQRYDGKEEFKENASFKLTRKKCLSCTVPVTCGARVWVRVNNMCFTRGVITKDGQELHVVTTKGKLVKCVRNKPEFLAVDKIPNPQDLSPGTRVVAQWYDRTEPLYLATVKGKQGCKYLITYDDDDEAFCELKNIRVLLWTASATEDIVEHPPWSSLQGIPRLSSGMLVKNEKVEKTVVKRKQVWANYRKISASDQHLDHRMQREDSFPSFLSRTASCRETSTKSFHWNHYCVKDGTTSHSVTLGNGDERRMRMRKNGTGSAPKFDR